MSIEASLQAMIVSNIAKYIKKFDGVKDFHISKYKNNRKHTRDTFLIRIWVEKDSFDAQNVMKVLNGSDSFEDEIKKICGSVAYVKYDVYYV